MQHFLRTRFHISTLKHRTNLLKFIIPNFDIYFCHQISDILFESIMLCVTSQWICLFEILRICLWAMASWFSINAYFSALWLQSENYR